MEKVVHEYLSIVEQELHAYMKNIDQDELQAAMQLILDCEKKGGRVHVTGIGKPGHVAGYVASLLSSTGTPAYELHGTEAVHGSSGQVCPQDVVIAISNSGETLELEATVNTLKNNKAQIIGCTGNANSKLANLSDVCLIAHVDNEGDTLNKAPRTSILAEILVLQCLSILLQEKKKLTLNQYVKWHPGGSLGKSILGNKEKK